MQRLTGLCFCFFMALFLVACSSDRAPGPVGSRDDITIRNANIPVLSAKPTPVEVQQNIEAEEAEKPIVGDSAEIDDSTTEATKPKKLDGSEQQALPKGIEPITEITEVSDLNPDTEATTDNHKMDTVEMIPPPEKQKVEQEVLPKDNDNERVPDLVDNTGDIPPAAQPGECYTKVLIPAVTVSEDEQVLVAPEHERLVRIIPAKYEIKQEKLLVREARTFWKKGRGPVEKVDESTGEILCLVEEPAVYKTVEKRELIEPEKPEYETVPARYETVSRSVVVEAERREWRRILCDTNVTTDIVMEIQEALNARGYKAGPVDGVIGWYTRNALRQFKKDQGLNGDGLTYEAIEALGITLSGA